MNTGLNRKTLYTIIALLLFIFGSLLLSINIYGLFQDIRKKNLDQVNPELLRFRNYDYISYADSIKKLKAIENKENFDYAQNANKIIQQSLTHIEWNKVNADEFRQRVPIWENYLLYLVGIVSNQPQLKRYHFVDYKRSLERGIGICGDASMVLSQILDRKGIDNQIVSFHGHVITEADLIGDEKLLLDPDFGVVLNMSLEELAANPFSAYPYYLNAGYSDREAIALVRIYGTKHTTFDDVYAFMPKRYVFEHLSYVFKWLIPVILLLVSVIILKKLKKHSGLPFNSNDEIIRAVNPFNKQ